MAARRPLQGRVPQLLGRRGECDVLDRLLGAVRAGESRALVVRGEPGAGKTALLDYLAGRPAGRRAGGPPPPHPMTHHALGSPPQVAHPTSNCSPDTTPHTPA